jgi:hypothetical protein
VLLLKELTLDDEVVKAFADLTTTIMQRRDVYSATCKLLGDGTQVRVLTWFRRGGVIFVWSRRSLCSVERRGLALRHVA